MYYYLSVIAKFATHPDIVEWLDSKKVISIIYIFTFYVNLNHTPFCRKKYQINWQRACKKINHFYHQTSSGVLPIGPLPFQITFYLLQLKFSAVMTCLCRYVIIISLLSNIYVFINLSFIQRVLRSPDSMLIVNVTNLSHSKFLHTQVCPILFYYLPIYLSFLSNLVFSMLLEDLRHN